MLTKNTPWSFPENAHCPTSIHVLVFYTNGLHKYHINRMKTKPEWSTILQRLENLNDIIIISAVNVLFSIVVCANENDTLLH